MVEVWTVAIGGHGRWPFDAGELIVFIADVATGGHSTSEFTVGARSHRFLLNSESARLSPTWHANYRCFINQTIKLIRLLHCSRKMMVASKRHEDLYWFRLEPYIQSQR
jgi:hypothetical protein